MPPNTSHRFEFLNLNNDRPESYRNSNGQAEEERNGLPEPYSILEHVAVNLPQCVKQLSKVPTTYRDHYCVKRCLPKPEKICLPFPAIRLSEEKMGGRSTYKNDFHLYSAKDRQTNRGELVAQRQSVTCQRQKFEGKSETKCAFKCPRPIEKNNSVKEFIIVKGVKRTRDRPRFVTTTTYSTEFKKPKSAHRTVILKPKLNISMSSDRFSHISQYTTDFKMPNKTTPEGRFRPSRYIPPSIPMDSVTTYKEAFTFKVPVDKRLIRRHPDYSCKECRRSLGSHPNQTKNVKTACAREFSDCGDGDRKTPGNGVDCHQEVGKSTEKRNLVTDKICRDPLECGRGIMKVTQEIVEDACSNRSSLYNRN